MIYKIVWFCQYICLYLSASSFGVYLTLPFVSLFLLCHSFSLAHFVCVCVCVYCTQMEFITIIRSIIKSSVYRLLLLCFTFFSVLVFFPRHKNKLTVLKKQSKININIFSKLKIGST